ncbi:hypothetical protein [Desulfovibrio sp. Fe33]|uniref:hypothetical protein n=1 Tax=Desulfovibrio sp. Fe33 TaxID=3020842 RepID=UPI00234DEBEE|nr:hypothetical protein [Desulfovibrio sp. Fe33]
MSMILRAAALKKALFFRLFLLGPAKEMDPAGRAWRLKGQSPFTGSRAKGALLSIKRKAAP